MTVLFNIVTTFVCKKRFSHFIVKWIGLFVDFYINYEPIVMNFWEIILFIQNQYYDHFIQIVKEG